jgi:hypothetical protein
LVPSRSPSPACSSEFSPPRCYQRFSGPASSVLPRICHPLAPARIGALPYRVGFLTALDSLGRQTSRASRVRRTPWPISRPAPRRFRFPQISGLAFRAGSTASPTPSNRFAVRYVHGFCLMLPSDTPFLVSALATFWRCPSVWGTAGFFLYFQPLMAGSRRVRHAGRTEIASLRSQYPLLGRARVRTRARARRTGACTLELS